MQSKEVAGKSGGESGQSRSDSFPSNRRSVRRFPGDTIDVVPLEFSGHSFAACVYDISVQGIGLIADRPVSPGAALTLRPEKRSARRLTAHVRHTRNVNESEWLLGCEFAAMLTTEDILALGQQD